MASYNTGVTGSLTAQPHGTAFTLTVPAGVLTGDVMIVSIEVFTQNGSSNSFGTPSSGGGNWTQISSTLTGTYTGGGTFPVYGMAWFRVATASDPGSTFTMSYTGTTPSPDQLWWAVDLEAYTGFYTTSPIGNTATFNNGNSTTITAPTTTTTAANSWEVDTCPVSIQASGTYSSEPLTNRHTVNTQGINSAVSDSNASVGASGTSIGGGNWVLSASPNNSGMAFTIELRTQAPAGATPSGTVQPLTTISVRRRRLSRAVVQFIPVTTFNTGHGPAGTVQPLATFPTPRRRPSRVVTGFTPVTTFNTGHGPAGTVQPKAVPAVMPRRRLSRAAVQFTPVRTTNNTAPPVVPVIPVTGGGKSMLARYMRWADL